MVHIPLMAYIPLMVHIPFAEHYLFEEYMAESLCLGLKGSPGIIVLFRAAGLIRSST